MLSKKNKTRFDVYRKYLKKSVLRYPQTQNNLVNDVVEEVTMSVLGPSMAGFVIWTLQQAMKNGIERLYFLARDGYFMYRMAEIFCERMKLPVECRYLCCSRYSVRLPMFHMDMEEALNYICRGGIDVTITKILERAGIGREEKKEILDELELSYKENEIIPYAELDKIKKKLRKCKNFTDAVVRISKEAMPGVRGYLRQEGLLDGVPYAIVDSGWVGSMQRNINLLLSHMGRNEELEGYYWGLYELPKDVNSEKYHCYYFESQKDLREKVFFSNCLFETIFSAPHGMTMGYYIENEIYKPRFGPCGDNRKRFMEQTEMYLQKYAVKIADRIRNVMLVDCYKEKKIIKKLLKCFMGNPSRAEAELYGQLEFSDDVLDNSRQQVAAPLNEIELCANHVGNKALVMLGIRKGYIKESAWYEGSVARYGRHERRHLLSYATYKYLLYIRQMYFKGESNV